MSDETTWQRTTTNLPEIDVMYRQEGKTFYWYPVEGIKPKPPWSLDPPGAVETQPFTWAKTREYFPWARVDEAPPVPYYAEAPGMSDDNAGGTT